jgi:hypothetical protein
MQPSQDVDFGRVVMVGPQSYVPMRQLQSDVEYVALVNRNNSDGAAQRSSAPIVLDVCGETAKMFLKRRTSA